MQRQTYSIFQLFLSLVLGLTYSCVDPQIQQTLDRADAIIEVHPDSAWALLSAIDRSSLIGREQKARYALLMSMAVDKNYIDTTTFDLLQPALDYYPSHGTPNEQLRTYYYQGRIFQNQGDRDHALQAFAKGGDLAQQVTDSLCLARLLRAEGLIYYEFYDMEGYADNFLKAADIYRLQPALKGPELDCLLHAYNGFIVLHDTLRADSLYQVCNQFDTATPAQRDLLQRCNLSFICALGSPAEIKEYMAHLDPNQEISGDGLLNLAFAYHKMGEDHRAMHLLDSARENHLAYDSRRYDAFAVAILKGLGNYQEALATYEAFTAKSDSINRWKIEQKYKSIEEKHQLELKAQEEAEQKSRIIWGGIGGMVLLLMGVILLLVWNRSKQARLKSEKERLSLENQNLQLERDKKVLEAENLAHRVEELEHESESLKSLVEAPEELPQEVQQAIQVRIEMLNSLLAGYITDNAQYEKPYGTWVKELTENTEAFMNSNRLAFQASHPHFIRYFEEHGLTVEEINYVCLYAIGLKGKEVGAYMKKRSHVNTSSTIRKKLGIDKHETNIGIYVRKLLKGL